MKTLYTILLLALFATESFATDCYTNGNGTDWNNPLNWVDGNVPDQSQDNIYIQHDMVKSSTLNMSKTGAELIVSPGATLTIKGTLKCNNKNGVYTIGGNLITTGNIEINKSSLTLLAGGSIETEHIKNTWYSSTKATLAIYDEITVKDITLSSCNFVIGDGVTMTCDELKGSNSKVNINIGNNVTCNINEGFQLTGATDVIVGNNSTLNITDDFNLADNNTDFDTGDNCTIIIGGSYTQTGKSDATFGDGLQLDIVNKLQVKDDNSDLIIGDGAIISVGNDFDVLWKADAKFGNSLQFTVSGDVEVNGNNSDLIFGDDSNIKFSKDVDILWGGDASFGQNNTVSISGDLKVKGSSSDLELNDNTTINIDGSVINQEADIILDNANLTISTDYTNKGGDLELNETSSVEVYGDLLNNDWGSSDIDISSNSQLHIHGDLTNKSSADVDGSGTLQVDGEIYNSGYINSNLLVINPTTLTWLGAVNENWDEAGNWDGATVPTISDNVVVPDVSNQPTITGIEYCKSLLVEEDAELTINAGASLHVDGDITIHTNANITIKDNSTNNSGQIYAEGECISSGGESVFERYFSLKAHHYISSPVDETKNTLNTSKKAKVKNLWDETSGTWKEISENLTSIGMGYDYYYTQNITAKFSGNSFNLEDSYDIPITNGVGEGYNLIGNPYPFAINAEALLNENTLALGGADAITGNIAIWDEGSDNTTYDESFYIIVNGAGSVSGKYKTFNGYIAPTQAFFVQTSSSTTGNLVVNKTMAAPTQQANFFKSGKKENDFKKVKLFIDNGQNLYNETLLAFKEGATLGNDFALDADIVETGKLSIYTFIDLKMQAIQTQPLLQHDEKRIIKLGVNVLQSGSFEINIKERLNIDENTKIYLEDLLNDSVIELGNEKGYFIDLEKKRYDNRFRLILKTGQKEEFEKIVKAKENEVTENSEDNTSFFNTKDNEIANNLTSRIIDASHSSDIHIFSYYNTLYVENDFMSNTDHKIIVFNLAGKKITEQHLSSQIKISLKLNPGIYLVSIHENENIVKTQKVYIQ